MISILDILDILDLTLIDSKKRRDMISPFLIVKLLRTSFV